MTLTPVFTANSVALADREASVALTFDFQRGNGAPTIAAQGSSSPTGVIVAQADVNGETIDVALHYDATNGKVANANWTDWAQMNSGTVLTVPSCKGATVSLYCYTATTTSTIDGQTDYTTSGNVVTATIGSSEETIDIVIGDGSYFRYVNVVLPVVEKSLADTTIDYVAGSLSWTVGNEDAPSISDDIAVAVSQASYAYGSDLSVSTASYSAVNSGTMVVYTPGTSNAGSVEGVMVEYRVKMAAGLQFTPTSVSYDAVKVGTDNATYSYGFLFDDEATDVSTMDKEYILRNNNNNSSTAELNHVHTFDGTQSGNIFALRLYVSGFASNKNCAFGNIVINGTVRGTAEVVAQYTLTAVASPEEAATITIYPKADAYDEGSEIKLTAARNFGYIFDNWTDADGNVVSEENVFTHTITADIDLTANFHQINTYVLDYSVDGGANDYMVQPSPAGTTVDDNLMYEEGTTVTLTASSNEILTFTNWSDGQSSSTITLTMDQDHEIVANYSAIDFVAAWDFYTAGSNGRLADFYSEGNDIAALVMRTESGSTSSWLDKSEEYAGGYEGRPAAVNWRTTGLGDYYWQTKVDASMFTNMSVISAMTYNYNAYTTQNVEYSLDGETWTLIGQINIAGAKTWTDATFAIPSDADNASALYLRWKSDTTSDIDGTTSDNDGIALGAIYILGDMEVPYDAEAPALVSSVPVEGASTASINGKIVLTFDKKVQLTDGAVAKLGDTELEGSASGKTLLFQYKNLNYSTDYTFTLSAGAVANLSGVANAEAITLTFTTRTRPTVTKSLYDAVVTNIDELVAAIESATKRDDTSKRYRIFMADGTYQFPASTTSTKTGSDNVDYPDPTTIITTPNLSLIGENRDAVIITNTQPSATSPGLLEGIGKGDVLQLSSKATETYMQDLTIKSAMGDGYGRDIELNDQSNKTVCKNVCLYGYQDTYVSNNSSSRFYFEGGVLRGRTDYLCGKGDVFYNGVTLQVASTGGYITAPSTPKQYGYVFRDCEIVAELASADGNFTLGRPWGSGSPTCYYIDTKMTARPSDIGWSEMSGGYPNRFAEYNSTTSTGTVIDLAGRKTVFADTHTNNPSLTKDEADAITYEAVMGGDDDWDPAALAEQAPAPTNVIISGSTLSWDDSDYALLWAVCKDGAVVDFTLEPTYTVDDTTATWSVRAANEMGGLGDAVAATTSTGISLTTFSADDVVSTTYYNINGLKVNAAYNGVIIKVQTLNNGQQVVTKIMK